MIKVAGIRKSFDTLEVIKGIDLEIDRGEIVAVVGPSGAGKTTLLQITGSLMRPDAGSVIYDIDGTSIDIYSLPERRLSAFRNRHIGFVFQFHQLLPEFSLIENVAMPAFIAGIPRKDALRRAAELTDYLGLSDRIHHRPAQLSGGERQRAAVARALVNSPEIVLADEPSGSLDTANREELRRLFFDIRRDLGTTFVIVTHDTSLTHDTDRVICMTDGLITDIRDNLNSSMS